MSDYIRADKQLLVALLGLTTSFLTGVILSIIEVNYGFALYSYMFWFIIPVGAIGSGLVASSGYYGGAVLFHQKPAGGVLLNMIGASIGAFFIIHYVPYFMLDIEGIQIREVISFWHFIDYDLTHTSVTFSRGNSSTGDLGRFWGYTYAALQVIGFSLGGAIVFGWLSSKPYCQNCSRYMKRTGSQERFTSESDILIDQIKHFTSLLDQHKCSEALSFHAENMGVQYQSGHHLKSRIITSRCSRCGTNHMDFITSKRDGDNWKEISETEMKALTDEQLNTAES